MKILFLVTISILLSSCMSMYSGCLEGSNVCEYEDAIMLKHPRSMQVVVCSPYSDVLLETCARGYEKSGFIRLREYPMYVPGSIRIDNKYYSSSY